MILRVEGKLARSYNVAVATLALDVPHKWLDNILSRHRIPGVEQHRQGITRRLSLDALVALAIIHDLCQHLHLPANQAVAIATRLTAAEDTTLTLCEGTISLAADREAITRRVTERLAHAIESAPQPLRGRPARHVPSLDVT